MSSGPLVATFLPELGMLGVSLRHRGEELLALPGGLDGYRAGDVTGLPLLAPWANRLGERRYEVEGVVVDLEGLALHTDDHGLPIHGTMTAQPGWEVIERVRALVHGAVRLRRAPRAPRLVPLPARAPDRGGGGRHGAAGDDDRHRDDRSSRSPSRSATTRTSASPASGGTDVRLRLPARRHLELDDRGLPTGATRAEDAEDERLGSRTFDDLYQLDDDRRLELTGGGRRLALELGEGYPFAQVFTPDAADSVCLEPMTAAVNALVDGSCALGGLPEARSPRGFSLDVELDQRDAAAD